MLVHYPSIKGKGGTGLHKHNTPHSYMYIEIHESLVYVIRVHYLKLLMH